MYPRAHVRTYTRATAAVMLHKGCGPGTCFLYIVVGKTAPLHIAVNYARNRSLANSCCNLDRYNADPLGVTADPLGVTAEIAKSAPALPSTEPPTHKTQYHRGYPIPQGLPNSVPTASQFRPNCLPIPPQLPPNSAPTASQFRHPYNPTDSSRFCQKIRHIKTLADTREGEV